MKRLFAIGFSLVLVLCSVNAQTTTPRPIVSTDHQKYSYNEMIQDLEQLQETYPECISFELKDTTYQGRQIPLVYFGNKEASKKIMMTASIHAREYMTSLLVMAMMEYYAKYYNTESFEGVKYSALFSDVCLIILPMVNPDGVEISQKGVGGAVTQDVKDWLLSEIKKGNKPEMIKANARGVDINRNFAYGFGLGTPRAYARSLDYYCGPYAYSEVESRMMRTVSDMYPYEFFLNYHTRGNMIYHGSDPSLIEENAQSKKIAKIVQRVTGYRTIEEYLAHGTWADELELCHRRGSVTIEVGTRNPVPISEFSTIFNKNKLVWATLLKAIYDHNL